MYPSLEPTLFIIYWTFLFAAVLLWFLTPERRIRARISERVYTDLAANEEALVAACGLRDSGVYIPRKGSKKGPPVRLFVPLHADYDLPDDADLESLFVRSDTEGCQGLSILPSGGRLFREFESILSTDLSASPDELSIQLADGITEGLELADRVTVDVQPAEQRVVFEITNSLYGPIGRFNHPVQSFLAVGLAVGFDQPVAVEKKAAEGRSDHVVTCYWGLDERLNDTKETRGDRSILL